MKATETDTRVELDQRTQDELAPPCDCGSRRIGDRRPCPRPAAYAVTLRCAWCGPRERIWCNEHLGKGLAGRVVCNPCGRERGVVSPPVIVDSVVRL